MAQLAFATVNVKHITHPQKRVQIKQMGQHVRTDCVQMVPAKTTHVQVVLLKHVRLIWLRQRHLKRHMGPNAIHVVVQVGQHSAVMVQHVFAIMNVKHIMHPPKHVSARQMVRPVQPVCVKQVSAQMIRVRPEQLKHARLI